MENLNFTAIDFETACSSRTSICQIGICKVSNSKIIFNEEFLIRPPDNYYSHWNVNVHGISPNITEDKPGLPEIWDQVKDHFENGFLVAHNAAFDIDCLTQSLDFYNLHIPSFQYECTYTISGLSLIDLAESLAIQIREHHNALNDALMCAEAYIKLKNGHKPDYNLISKKDPKPFFEGHERLSGNVLKPDLKNADPASPFYGKKVVFTGVMSQIARKEAAQIVKKMGADIDTGITKRTNFVLVGRGAGPSKISKIKKYNNSGCNIKLIHETEFLEMIGSYSKV